MRLAFFTLLTIIASTQLHGQTTAPDVRDIEFGRPDGIPLLLDIYYAREATRPWPVVVFIHGGGWQSGDKRNPKAAYLVSEGYAVVSINYRLTHQAIMPAQIHDCKAAIRWVRANAARYGFDADRIGIWGSSAGGHLVALLGTSGAVAELEGDVGGNEAFSSDVQAVCDWYGPSNFLTIGDWPSNIDHSSPNCPEAKLIGGTLPDHPAEARAASPITYVSTEDPPFLIMHGTEDMVVPFHQSVELDSALARHGVYSDFIPMTGDGHGGGGFATAGSRNTVKNFFDRFLKRTTHVGNRVPQISSSRVPGTFDLQLAPNPARARTSVTLKLSVGASLPPDEELSLRIFDLYGRVRYGRTIQTTASQHDVFELHLRGLPAGNYFVLVGAGEHFAGSILSVLH